MDGEKEEATGPPMKKAWKWEIRIFCGVLAFLLLVVGGTCWRATLTIRRHEKETADKIAEIRARDPARSPLLGEGVAGNGWEAYTRALDAIAAIPEAEVKKIPAVQADPDYIPDPDSLEALFAKYGGHLKDLEDALSRREFRPPYPYEEGFEMLTPYVSKTLRAVKYLAGEADHLHSKGRDREALDRLFLAIGLSQDTGRGGPIINMLIQYIGQAISAEAARTILAEHALSVKDLERAASVLDRLQASRPSPADGIEVEGVTNRRTLVLLAKEGSFPQLSVPAFASWRYLFSVRLMAVAALDEMKDLFEEFRKIAALPSHTQVAAAESLVASRVMDSSNPLVQVMVPALGKVFMVKNKPLLDFSLLRVATAIAWYEAEKGAYPAKLEDLAPRYISKVPDCPYSGTPLRYDGAGKVWSIGGDGDDDGGKPLAEQDEMTSDGDVVWIVKRKQK